MIKIEKITDFDSDNIIYRLSIGTGGHIKYQEIPCTRQEFQGNPTHIKERIMDGIDHLLFKVKNSAINNIQEIFRQTGDFDNSNQESTIEQLRESRSQQQAQHFAIEQQRRLQAAQVANNAFGDFAAGFRVAFDEVQPEPDKKRKSKEDKAMKLLKSKIGKKKFNDLGKKGYFEERGKYGIYRFHMNNPHGVTCIKKVSFGNKKRPLEWDLCIQSSVPDMPKGDIILSRWMEFKADEDKFIKTANFRNVRTIDEAIDIPSTDYGLSYAALRQAARALRS